MEKNNKRSLSFELKIDPREKLVIHPLSLVFAAFAATFTLYSPNMGILTGYPQGEELVGYFVFSMIISALILALITMLYAAKHDKWQCFSLSPLGLATVSYISGVLAFFILIQLSNAYLPLAVVAGVCVGVGLVPICVAWGTHFSMPLKNALLWGALICVLASLLSWTMSLLPAQAMWVVYPALVIVGSAMPMLKLRKGTLSFPEQDRAFDEETSHDEGISRDKERSHNEDSLPFEGGESIHASEQRGIFANIRHLLSIIWLPFSGLLLYAFLTSVHKLLVFELLDSEFLGGALAGLCIIPLCFIKTSKPLLPFVYKVIVPVFIAVLIVLGGFPVDSLPQYLGAVGVYIFCIFLALFALASLMAVTHAGEFTPPFIYGFALLCGTAVTLFGLIQSQVVVVTDNFGPVMWVITCVYFAAILIYLGISSWKSFSTPEDASNVPGASLHENLQLRCEAIADRSHLSKREREILGYLSRGYSPTYIAKTLIISVSTARSHVRNIYRKINVSSREELLQLIDDESS